MQTKFNQSVSDRSWGTASALVAAGSGGLISHVGGQPYDAENFASAQQFAGGVIAFESVLLPGASALDGAIAEGGISGLFGGGTAEGSAVTEAGDLEGEGLFSGGYKGRGLSQAEVDELTAEFQAGGGVVDQSADAQAYLKMRGAGGLTLNESTILLPASPTRTAVFEELVHAKQFAAGVFEVGPGGTLHLEANAAETLISNRRAFALPNDEVRQVVTNLRNLRAAIAALAD